MRYKHFMVSNLWFWLQMAVQNALRYIPPSAHRVLAEEFASELRNYGHIYMYRFLPQFPVRWDSTEPIESYFLGRINPPGKVLFKKLAVDQLAKTSAYT